MSIVQAPNFRQQLTQALVAAQVSEVVRPVGYPVSASAVPQGSGTFLLEATLDTVEAIEAGTAAWFNWNEMGNRVVGKLADSFNCGISGMRCTCLTGNVKFSVIVP